jgi:glutamyl-tRNA reductase
MGTFVAVGLSHSSAPLSLLERMALDRDRTRAGLPRLVASEHISAAVIVSTCNRTEIYAEVTGYHAGVAELRSFLCDEGSVRLEDLVDHLYTYHGHAAVRHLLRVASGLDSMLIGEQEILGQVRRAFQDATERGVAGGAVSIAFRRALTAGKRARSETEIARQPVSVPRAAMELVRRSLGRERLQREQIAILGAGTMGALIAQAAAKAGAGNVVVLNRSAERAIQITGRFGGRFAPLSDLEQEVAASSVLICCTASDVPIVEVPLVARAVARRPQGRRLLVVDVAMPRDVEAGVREIPGVSVSDLGDLASVVEANLGRRLQEVSKVEAIIEQELRHFIESERVSAIGATLSALVAHGEALRQAELRRLRPGTGELTLRQWQAVEQLSSRIVAKMLHPALSKAKALAGTTEGDVYLAALRELFDLDRPSGDAIEIANVLRAPSGTARPRAETA